MTSELTMLKDRLMEINKALTEKGSTVVHGSRQVPEDICIDVARAVQQAIERADLAMDSYPEHRPASPSAGYPAPAETALP